MKEMLKRSQAYVGDGFLQIMMNYVQFFPEKYDYKNKF